MQQRPVGPRPRRAALRVPAAVFPAGRPPPTKTSCPVHRFQQPGGAAEARAVLDDARTPTRLPSDGFTDHIRRQVVPRQPKMINSRVRRALVRSSTISLGCRATANHARGQVVVPPWPSRSTGLCGTSGSTVNSVNPDSATRRPAEPSHAGERLFRPALSHLKHDSVRADRQKAQSGVDPPRKKPDKGGSWQADPRDALP